MDSEPALFTPKWPGNLCGSVALTGGRLSQSISTVDEIVGLLNTTPAVTALMTVTGSGTAVVASVTGTTSLSGSRVEYHASEVTQYAWDVPGRLASVTLPDGQQHRYDYDYRTRRIGTHQTASGSSATKNAAIVLSGGLSVAEFVRATNTAISDTSIPAVEYLRGRDMGGGVGGLLASFRSPVNASKIPIAGTKTVRYNLSNGRGDVVAQSDASGILTWTASYEAYGKRTKETDTTANADKQRANSKDEDPTGLLNEGFRYRDLETGVWLSRDPAGFVDGPNLYAYVKQNPWTSWDPLGLAEDTGDGTRILTDSSGYTHVLSGNADYPNHHYRNALEVSLNDNNPENLDRAMTKYAGELRADRAETFAKTIMAEAEDPEGARQKWDMVGAVAMSWGAGPRSPRSAFRPKSKVEPTHSGQQTHIQNEKMVVEMTPEQALKLKQFDKKTPKNLTPATVDPLTEGQVLFTSESPGKVPGSKKVYQKAVAPDGETTSYTKTTVTPDGRMDKVTDALETPEKVIHRE